MLIFLFPHALRFLRGAVIVSEEVQRPVHNEAHDFVSDPDTILAGLPACSIKININLAFKVLAPFQAETQDICVIVMPEIGAVE
jgi:hypothetical protein